MLTTAEGAREGRETVSESVKEKIFDPFLYRAEMPFSELYYPLGFPLRLTTNSPEVLTVAQESWGEFRQRFQMAPIQLQIGVLESELTECPGVPILRAQGHLMVWIAEPGNFFAMDLLRDFSFGWLTTAAVSHSGYLSYHVLETAALCHITNRYSTSVHAACVARNRRGVMLCGESGVGKSTLAFACARAGWTYITDDGSLLVHGRNDRQVLGNCYRVRLRPAAADLFTELRGRPLTRRANGKPSIELFTSSMQGITTATEAQVDYVVFLNRRDASVQELLSFPKEAARRYVSHLLSGIEELRPEQAGAVERLLTAEVLELRYRDLDWAIGRLERMIREGS